MHLDQPNSVCWNEGLFDALTRCRRVANIRLTPSLLLFVKKIIFMIFYAFRPAQLSLLGRGSLWEARQLVPQQNLLLRLASALR